MIEILGYFAAFLFISGAASQAVKSTRDGYSDVSHGLVWSLIIGFMCMGTYTVQVLNSDPVLMTSYTLQTACMLVIGYFKYFPRKSK